MDDMGDGFDGDAFDSDDEAKAEQLFLKYTSEASATTSTSNISTVKDEQQQKLTFRDLFGSPDKRKSLPRNGKSNDASQIKSAVPPSFNKNKDKYSEEGIVRSLRSHATESKVLYDEESIIRSLTTAHVNESKVLYDEESIIRSLTAHAAVAAKSNFNDFLQPSPTINVRPSADLPKPKSNPFILNSISNIFVIDPYSKLRLVKNSISLYSDEFTPIEKSLKDRNISTPYVPLRSIGISKNFWTTCVLVRKAGMRQSSKGNDYALWEVNDFHNVELNWTVFLFGMTSNAPSLQCLEVGSIIDLINPNILDDAGSSSNSSSSNSKKPGIKFSLTKTNQVRFIGKAHDFGYCEATRKDGKPCTAVVNTFICPVCIHHASSELKKSMRKSNSKKNGNKSKLTKPYDFHANRKLEWKKRAEEGVVTANFSAPVWVGKDSKSIPVPICAATSSSSKPALNPVRKSLTRMELQDSSSSVKRCPIQFGNHSSITFVQEDKNSTLLSIPKCDKEQQANKKALVLDPEKTRHLTEKDRKILEALSKSKNSISDTEKSSLPTCSLKIAGTDLPSLIASTTNAGSRNVLEYFNAKNKAEELKKRNSEEVGKSGGTTQKIHQPDGQPLIMTRETMNNMKKALNYVKQSGPIKKVDPNSIPKLLKFTPTDNKTNGVKRKLEDVVQDPLEKMKVSKNDLDNQRPCFSGASKSKSESFLTTTRATSKATGNLLQNKKSKLMQSEEFLQILNAKSSHAALAEEIKEDEYFTKLERREAIENKLLSTYSIPTTAVMCKECKYIAIGQSDYCKEKRHVIKMVQANKRFFKCKDCGQRTMSLDRLPKKACTNCRSSSWVSTSVGKERNGPVLDSEVLAIRGDEEKFVGASSGKKYLNL